MPDKYRQLPYDFDLHYDIVSYDELIRLLTGNHYRTMSSSDMLHIIQLTNAHKIELPIEVNEHIKAHVESVVADYQALLNELEIPEKPESDTKDGQRGIDAETYKSWKENPDRMGGMFTAQEIADSEKWI